MIIKCQIVIFPSSHPQITISHYENIWGKKDIQCKRYYKKNMLNMTQFSPQGYYLNTKIN